MRSVTGHATHICVVVGSYALVGINRVLMQSKQQEHLEVKTHFECERSNAAAWRDKFGIPKVRR